MYKTGVRYDINYDILNSPRMWQKRIFHESFKRFKVIKFNSMFELKCFNAIFLKIVSPLMKRGYFNPHNAHKINLKTLLYEYRDSVIV